MPVPTAPLPTVGVTIGPTWASMVNTAILELQTLVTGLETAPDPTTVKKSVNYQVTTTDTRLIASGGSGALTFTLPVSPAQGQRIEIGNHNAAFGLTIARNGQTINNVAADLALTGDKGCILYFISGSGWYTLGQL